MVCNNCGVSNLVIKNGYYFCPHCKIYISKVSGQEQPAPFFIPGMKIPGIINNTEPPKKSLFSKYFTFRNIVIIFLLWITLIFLNNFLYVDIFEPCFIPIYPSWFELSNATIKQAMGVIKKVSLQNYHNICKRVRAINPNMSCGIWNGGCFSWGQPFNTIDVSASRNLIWMAEVISHEACHVQQHDEGRPGDENECWLVGLPVMQAANGH